MGLGWQWRERERENHGYSRACVMRWADSRSEFGRDDRAYAAWESSWDGRDEVTSLTADVSDITAVQLGCNGTAVS